MSRNVGVACFVDVQKVFDTLSYGILLTKLEHHGIKVLSNAELKVVSSTEYNMMRMIYGHQVFITLV